MDQLCRGIRRFCCHDCGIDHIGLGGDFDGISQTVKDLDNVSTYPRLTAELLKRGYSDGDIRKILGLNILRVMRESEKVSRRLQSERGPSVVVMASAQAPAPSSSAEPVEITLQRTPCFGTCPEYTVTLRGDGTVTYVGHQFVRTPGNHTWKIDPAVVRALAREMEAAGFFEMQDSYRALVTDHPTTYTTLKIGTRTKKIQDYVAGPPKLKDIEAKIDEVSGVKKFVSPESRLVHAVEIGDADAVRSLLAVGANVTVADEDGVTLVMRAAAAGNAATVRLLLAAGADPTARDRHGRNAADRARDGLADDTPKPFDLILKLLTDE